MQAFVFVSVSCLPFAFAGWEAPLERAAKISPQERDELGKHAALVAQQAYAPTKAGVAKFLSVEARMETKCAKCLDKDYSDPCPLGWAELVDGRCASPPEYEGACNTSQTFIGSTVAAKMELEMVCGLCWPCTKGAQPATCIREYSRPCPYGYVPQDIAYSDFRDAVGTSCSADLFYEGECEQQVHFKDIQAKQEFSERCAVSWPCRRDCEDSLAHCPDGWQSAGGSLCMAPDYYKVDGCPLLGSFSGWTSTMKREFGQTCGVEWLCTGTQHEELCQQLDLTDCPRDWLAKDGGNCIPPADDQGACAQATRSAGGVRMSSMSAEQKIRWAADCGVDWPCIGGRAVADASVGPRSPAQADSDSSGPIDSSGSVVRA